MSTLCPEHFSPVLQDGGPEPEIKTIWPFTPCEICGKQPPGYEAIGKENWVVVSRDTIERARKAIR